MSSTTKHIYDEHIRPLPREERKELFDLLRSELEDSDDNARPSILELRGLGKEIWEGVNAADYVRKLRDEWKERAR